MPCPIAITAKVMLYLCHGRTQLQSINEPLCSVTEFRFVGKAEICHCRDPWLHLTTICSYFFYFFSSFHPSLFQCLVCDESCFHYSKLELFPLGDRASVSTHCKKIPRGILRDEDCFYTHCVLISLTRTGQERHAALSVWLSEPNCLCSIWNLCTENNARTFIQNSQIWAYLFLKAWRWRLLSFFTHISKGIQKKAFYLSAKHKISAKKEEATFTFV